MDIIISTISYQSPIHGYEILFNNYSYCYEMKKRKELTNLDYEYMGHFDLTARIIFRVHLTKLDFNNRREI